MKLLITQTDTLAQIRVSVQGLVPMPAATAESLGAVIVGEGLAVAVDGTLSAPPATAERLGEVIVGDGLAVAEDGTLSVSAATAESLGAGGGWHAFGGARRRCRAPDGGAVRRHADRAG
jgi:hypothetical protein